MKQPRRHDRRRGGFSLIESMVATGVMATVVGGTMSAMYVQQRNWASASTAMATSGSASHALEDIVYGSGTRMGLRAASGDEVVFTPLRTGWRLTYDDERYLEYRSAHKDIVDQSGKVLCERIESADVSSSYKGCRISITVLKRAVGRPVRSRMTTFVQYRN